MLPFTEMHRLRHNLTWSIRPCPCLLACAGRASQAQPRQVGLAVLACIAAWALCWAPPLLTQAPQVPQAQPSWARTA